jgi:DeoR family transcriptional regulator of aga operon
VFAAQRQARIVQHVQEDGFVEIVRLSKDLGVDRSTVRRDLHALEKRGLVRRSRGGALAGPSAGEADIPYAVKRVHQTPAKEAIAAYAAQLIRPSEAVLLDSGSTTFQLARALRQRQDISVVTNDINVAMCLAESPGIQLIVTGGILLESVYALVGPRTVAELRDLHVDRAFLGADAIHHEDGVTNVTFVEVEVKRAMIETASEVVVLADATKFGHRALAPVCELDAIDLIVTNEGLDPDVRSAYGERLHCVPLSGKAEARRLDDASVNDA